MHLAADHFEFDEARNTMVFVCARAAVREEVGGAWDVFENPSEPEDRTGGRDEG